MRIAVFGAGAIGGFIAAALARSGIEVAIVARGAHLRAIQRQGLRVRSELGDFTVKPQASDDLRRLGDFSFVLLTFKAHDWRNALPQMDSAIASGAAFVTLQNGLPFWAIDGWQLETVDPGGSIAATIPRRSIIGGVVHASGSVAEPGLIVQSGGRVYPLGELDGSVTPRLRDLANAFQEAGLEAPIEPDIRKIVWRKLLGNLAFNPISALTGATMTQMLTRPHLRALALSIMEEGLAVARADGVEIGVSLDERLRMAERTGDVKTSMLQDLENGRPLELEPINGAIVELARRLNVAVPRTETVYALAKALDGSRSAR